MPSGVRKIKRKTGSTGQSFARNGVATVSRRRRRRRRSVLAPNVTCVRKWDECAVVSPRNSSGRLSLARDTAKQNCTQLCTADSMGRVNFGRLPLVRNAHLPRARTQGGLTVRLGRVNGGRLPYVRNARSPRQHTRRCAS